MNTRGILTGIAWITLLLIAAITVLALFSSFYGWPQPLELLSHFQVQYLILSLILWGGLLMTRRWVPVVIAGVLVGALSTQILPWYFPPAESGRDQIPDLRVVLANINTRNLSYDRVLNLIRQTVPDVVVLMEVSPNWFGPLSQLQGQLPYTYTQTGNYLLSRIPLQATRSEPYGSQGAAAVLAQITIGAQPITLIGAHPWPPLRPSLFHSRNRHLDGLGNTIQTLSTPVIVMGDLNITPWSPYYRRLITRTGLINTRRGFGILPSWPDTGTYVLGLEFLLLLPIDHCLVSPEFETLNIEIGPSIDSDHWPVIVDLKLRGS